MLRPVPVADPAAEIAAWWRLVELCLPTHEKCGALTFAPSGTETLEGDWKRWVTDVFLPVLHPALLSLQNAAAAQDNVRLLCEDAALGTALTADAAQRGLLCGRHLLLACQPPQGAKFLERLRETALHRAEAGQLATIFAVRGQIFHLPFVQVAGALVLAECVLGADAAGVTMPAARTIDLMQGAMDSVAAVPSVQLLAV